MLCSCISQPADATLYIPGPLRSSVLHIPNMFFSPSSLGIPSILSFVLFFPSCCYLFESRIPNSDPNHGIHGFVFHHQSSRTTSSGFSGFQDRSEELIVSPSDLICSRQGYSFLSFFGPAWISQADPFYHSNPTSTSWSCFHTL